jgi:hypothetical protein
MYILWYFHDNNLQHLKASNRLNIAVKLVALLLFIHEVLNKMYIWRSALLTSHGFYGCP